MTSVAIIGTGFGGMAAAIELKKAGFDDLIILEKADEVGGVWRENDYPGAACDVPSPFYSYSFELNPHWPHRFSRQPAILDYLKRISEKYDLRRHVRFGAEVVAATWRDDRWHIELADGEAVTAEVLVSAVGQLSRPAIPPIPGSEDFAGPAFHSAQWDHSVDLTGKRIGVIGTGASAIQFVPEIQPLAEQLTVFQRTPPYLMYRMDRTFGRLHRFFFEKLPRSQWVERATWWGTVESLTVAWLYLPLLAAILKWRSKRHMRRQTAERPGLFEKVWPDYPMGCKRVLFSNDYLPALCQPNVDLETTGIERITPAGVRTTDGVDHKFDVLIWGTGFAATEFLAPMKITGQGGVDLRGDAWAGGARAYFGMTVPGFPNFHIMYGPNTNTGGGSVIYYLEIQARYLKDYVRAIEAAGPLAVDPDVAREHDERQQRKLAKSVWNECDSWYRNEEGRIVNNWSGLGPQYRVQARFRDADYVTAGHPS